MMNQMKKDFSDALVGIRNKVVKSDGFLSGGSKCKFDVSDVDVTRAWRSMNNMETDSSASEALSYLTDRGGLPLLASVLCMNTSASNESISAKINANCGLSPSASLLVVREARACGLDLNRVISDLRRKSCVSYSVRGVTFGPEMLDLVAMACMISVRADCSSPVGDMDDASVLDALTMAYGSSTEKECVRAMEVLRKLDPSVRSNGSVKSVKGHVVRIAHRYWYQRGICPEFMRETISRLLVKVANATTISDEDYIRMEWIFRSAATLSSMVHGCDCEIGIKQVHDAVRLRKSFDQMADIHSDAYVSLAFYERFGDDFVDVASLFGPSDDYSKGFSLGVDVEDRNSVIVNQPVTTKVGSSTVHSGKKLASNGDFFDILASDEGASPFDELSR